MRSELVVHLMIPNADVVLCSFQKEYCSFNVLEILLLYAIVICMTQCCRNLRPTVVTESIGFCFASEHPPIAAAITSHLMIRDVSRILPHVSRVSSAFLISLSNIIVLDGSLFFLCGHSLFKSVRFQTLLLDWLKNNACFEASHYDHTNLTEICK